MADLLAYGEDIIGFPGGEATAKVKLMKLLWENPDPTQSIAADTEFNINTAGYDLVMFVIAYSTGYLQYKSSVIVPQGTTTDLFLSNDSGTGGVARSFNYVSDTKYKAGAGYNNGTASTAAAIPLVAYGIKLEQEIPVVAENVSTLAANCLLSDGETSVEDALDELNDTSSYSGTGYRVDKVGKTCILTIDGATGTFNVPAAYKPNGVYRDIVASANGEFLGRSVITVTGDVTFNPATSSGKYGSIVYFV